MNLPREFCRRMETVLGNDAISFFVSFSHAPSRALRLVPEKVSYADLKEALGDDLGEKLPFGKNVYRFQSDGIGNLAYHHGGGIYVQEPAAMAPVFSLPPIKADRILDLCAAPGGKSLQAADTVLSEKGVLVCNEPDPKRRRTLMQNVERMGLARCQVTGFDARSLPDAWQERFDLVLCDAPCSGEGMMRKNQDAIDQWSMENILVCAERQKELLKEAYRVLSPGGILLYSTCTWSPEENEEVVLQFLAEKSDCHLLPVPDKIKAVSASGLPLENTTADLSLTRRFYPHLFAGEGQFLAVIQKQGEKSEQKSKEKKQKKGQKKSPKQTENELAVRAFFEQNLKATPDFSLYFRDQDAYLVPQGGIEEGLCASPGVLVGTVQKGRLVPHHRFFLAFADSFLLQIRLEATDPRVEAYLRGEEISLDAGRGWGVLFCHNCPLGGVKLSDGRGKNFYPKGLRKV